MIVVFTKYDQFVRNVKIDLMEKGCYSETRFATDVENMFHEYYLGDLIKVPPFVRLNSEDFLINLRLS